MEIIEILLAIILIQLAIIIALVSFHIITSHQHRQKIHKSDPLVKHIKDYISEGHTIEETRKKLKEVGFSEHRITKVIHDFLRE
ncbi:MAG: hypothetical protein ACMXYE_05625 [Candidatus Woesearchaeota archaeon]